MIEESLCPKLKETHHCFPTIFFLELHSTTQTLTTRTHTHPYEYTQRKPYPYEHLPRTEHRQIWRFSKSPQAPRRRRERRLPLNA
jgi:hypothetical protein